MAVGEERRLVCAIDVMEEAAFAYPRSSFDLKPCPLIKLRCFVVVGKSSRGSFCGVSACIGLSGEVRFDRVGDTVLLRTGDALLLGGGAGDALLLPAADTFF